MPSINEPNHSCLSLHSEYLVDDFCNRVNIWPQHQERCPTRSAANRRGDARWLEPQGSMWREGNLATESPEIGPPDAWGGLCIFAPGACLTRRHAPMWSLPDIKRLNSEALLNRETLERAVQTGVLNGKRLRCESGR